MVNNDDLQQEKNDEPDQNKVETQIMELNNEEDLTVCEEDPSSCHTPSSFGQKVSPPITLLQEICSRNGFTAEYQLLSTEGSVHEPTFKIAVTVDDVTVTASGQSKKKARHAAAREAIEQLRLKANLNFDGIDIDSMTSLGEPTTKSVCPTTANEANPVGKLQEICMKMRVNPPDYVTIGEQGLAHERIFVLTCHIASLDLTSIGDGRSKKLAKRQAAEIMLSKLESSEIYDKTAHPKSDNQGTSSLNMDADDNSHFVRTRRIVKDLVRHLTSSIKELIQDIRHIEENNVDEDLYYNLFHDLIEDFGHMRFKWIGDTICVLQVLSLDDEQLTAVFGKGKTQHEAMKDAVMSTIKIMLVMIDPLIQKDHQTLQTDQNQVGHHQEADLVVAKMVT